MSGLQLLLSIGGGVALLLWSTRMIRTGIMRAYGAQLRRFLGRSTRRSLSAFGMGLGVAGLLQSSTATALLLVSFAGRGLIATAPGLALMLGADVGSTLVVQVLSFDVSWVSPVFLLAGVIAFMSTQSQLWRHLGRVMIGLGLMLLALTLVVGASESLRGSAALETVIAPLASEPILALILAALLTWLAHSSVAIVLLIMSLTVTGVVPLTLGFVLVLGANVGAGIVPVVLTHSGSRAARRIPLGNLVFRFVGALVVLPLVTLIAPYLELFGGEASRQVANFHTAFNLALALVCLPLIVWVAKLVERVLPDDEATEGPAQAKYLDEDAIDTPSIALSCATREVLRMADTAELMLRDVMQIFENNDQKLLEQTSKLDDDLDRLHESIKLYLTRVSRNPLNEEDSKRCVELISLTTNLEHIGDIIDKNLLELAQKKIRQQVTFSRQGWEELTDMHARVLDQMQLAMSVFVSADVHIARQLLAGKERLRDLEREHGEAHIDRLRGGQLESIETSAFHLDILRDLRRINSHLTSVAYPILDAEGVLRRSRLRKQPKRDVETKNPQDEKRLRAGKQIGETS